MNTLKVFESHCNGNRCDKMALRTTLSKMSNSKWSKTRTGCQYVRYFYHSENLNWAAQNPRLGRGLDIAGLDSLFYSCYEFIVRPICGVIMSPHYFPISQAQDDLQQWIAATNKLGPISCSHNAAPPWANQRKSRTDDP